MVDVWNRDATLPLVGTRPLVGGAAALKALAEDSNMVPRPTGDSAVDAVLDLLTEISETDYRQIGREIVHQCGELDKKQLRRLHTACDMRRKLILNYLGVWEARTPATALRIAEDDVCVNFVWLEKGVISMDDGRLVDVLDRSAVTDKLPTKYMDNLTAWAARYRTNLFVYRSTQEFKETCMAQNIAVIGEL